MYLKKEIKTVYICKCFDFKNVLLLLLISQIPCGSKGK